MTDSDAQYHDKHHNRIVDAVLLAVWEANRIEDAEESVVDPDKAMLAMCDAIAVLRAAKPFDATPRERRSTADRCRKRIFATSNRIAEATAAGGDLGWEVKTIQRN